MRIKEFLITRYGPISEKGNFRLGNFNLFFGRNEEGKTLMLDSIVRLLFKSASKIFDKIDRVIEKPEGFIIIEIGNGELIKFPERGELTKFTGLSVREYRDIFIIRSSDLSISEEDKFYRNVQNRLTGLRTDEIEKISTRLLEIGKLTQSGEFRNIKDEKLKLRLLTAKQTIKRVERIEERIKDEGFEEMEKELLDIEGSIKSIDEESDNYEDARKRELYEKGITSLGSLLDARNEMNQLEVYKEGDEEIWRDSERDIEKFKEEKRRLGREMGECQNGLKEMREELGKKERDFLVYIDTKKKLDDDIMPEVKYYEKQSLDFAKGKGVLKILTISEIIFALLCGVSIIGVILSNYSIFRLSFFVFGAMTILFVFENMWFLRKKWSLSGLSQKIRIMTAKYGLSADNVENIILNINGFVEDFSKMEEDLNRVKTDLITKENGVKRIDKEIKNISEKMRICERNIARIKRRSGVETREEYNEMLNKKRGYEKIWAQESGILKSYFGVHGKKEEDVIKYWQKKIDEYKMFKDKARDISYEEKKVSLLRSKRDALVEKDKEVRKRMGWFMNELREIERIVNNEILKTTETDYLDCKTSVDLNFVKDKLKNFIAENERKRKVVLNVKDIFEDIAKEEEEKVSALFGKGSRVSSHFSKVTKGMYQVVEYDSEIKTVQVLSKDGGFLSAEKLSSGAFDQLYLSIRLALGEKILKGEKGFFIMDDPFVKSDIERLKRELNILKGLAQSGWQIIYFSAKDEIKNCLKTEIKDKEISYFEI